MNESEVKKMRKAKKVSFPHINHSLRSEGKVWFHYLEEKNDAFHC